MLLDDHLLLGFLTAVEPPPAPLATTGHWYYRLCRATVAGRPQGWLRQRLASFSQAEQQGARQRVLEMPPEITLVGSRQLAPMMATLSTRHRLNVLGLEALAAALHLGVGIHVSAANVGPKLRQAAAAEGVPYVVVA